MENTKNVGICFSKELTGDTPLSHITAKLPVYLDLLDLINEQGWQGYVLTRKTYKGNGVFAGGWIYKNKKFTLVPEEIKVDLVFDRTGGINFPVEGDKLIVVNERDFKVLAWDKWAAFRLIGEYMPRTFLVENESQIKEVLPEIKTEKIVLKPFNGMKGLGVFIGSKEEALNFKFPEKYDKYIAQEFIDTSAGITGVTSGLHDLRIAMVNGTPVWCHVRVPPEGSLLANAAQGGNLTEVDYEKVPETVKEVVQKISKIFSEKYDNPIYSLDFGIHADGTPRIFEINDQFGFPKPDMKKKDFFLKALIENFKEKLQRESRI